MNDLLAAAEEWLALGDYGRAAQLYGWLIDLGEDGAYPLIRRAAVWTGLGRLAEAEADLERAVQAEPEMPWALVRRATLRQMAGRQGAASQDMREAEVRAPWSDEVHANACLNFIGSEWLDLARRAALQLPPDATGWWGGVREKSLQAYAERRALVRADLRARRSPAPPPPLELAQGLFRLGRLRAARTLCEARLRDAPADPAASVILARVVQREAGSHAAADYLREVEARVGSAPERRDALVLAEHDAGRHEEVLRLLAGCGPEDEIEALRHVHAVSASQLGREEELRRFCRAWLAAAPQATAPAGFVASAELRTGRRPALSASTGGGDFAGVRMAQFWDSAEVPADVRDVMDSWSLHHPGLERTVYDEASARAYLLSGYGAEMAATFDLCRHAAMKADLFRLAFLHRSGGVWADADELCLRPMGGLLAHAADTEVTAALSGDLPGYVHNFFMGARPGGRLLAAALDEASAGVRHAAATGGKPDIWMTTGPGLVTRVIARHLLKAWDAGRPTQVTLLAGMQYGAFARTENGLAYKSDRANNWHLS